MVREELGGVGGDLSLTVYFFTPGPTQVYTSQPFSLHCNKKFIHAAGDHHGSRQNIRLVRTDRTQIFWQVMPVQQPVQYGRDAAHISWAA